MKVFICSTVYDLVDLRAELKESLEKWGYEPILSDHSDTTEIEFNVNSYEACVQLVKETDILILIVDKRYGGIVSGDLINKNDIGFIEENWLEEELTSQNLFSITEFEYLTAVKNNIPRINFCREDVWNSQQHSETEGPKFFDNFSKTMNFLDKIRKVSDENTDNWIHRFKDSPQLKKILKKKLLKGSFLPKTIQNYRHSIIESNKETFERYVQLEVEDVINKEPSIKEYHKLEDIVKKSNSLIILGKTGGGKSTSLKQIAYIYANDQEGLIPLIIELRYYKGGNIIDYLIKDNFTISKKDLFRYLAEGRLVLLFDGLDEIPPKYLDECIHKLNLFFYNYKQNKIVFTSKEQDYTQELEKTGIKVYKIRILDEGRIIKFLVNNRGIHQKEAKKLFESFDHRMKHLASNPLMLQMISDIYDTEKKPKNKNELFSDFVNYLLKKIVTIDHSILIELCSIISYRMLEEESLIFSNRLAKKLILEFLRIEGEVFDVNQLLDSLFRSKLIQKVNLEEFEFIHPLFLKYFASRKLKDKIFDENLEINHELFLDKLEHISWDEVWLFLIGGLETIQAKKIIEEIQIYDDKFAARCLREYKGSKNDFQPLIDKLFDACFDTETVDTLIMIADDEIEMKLINLLENDDYIIRSYSVRALRDIGSDETVRFLIRLLDNDSPRFVSYLSRMLGRLGSVEAVEPLIKLLGDDSPRVVNFAAKALGDIGSVEAVEPLIRLLDNDDSAVRRSAAKALGRIGSGGVVKSLIRLLDNQDSRVVISAVNALGVIGSVEVVEPLIRLLDNDDLGVRRSVANALGVIGSVEAVEPLIRLLDNQDSKVVISAAKALSRIGSVEVVEPLIRLLDNDDVGVRHSAVNALGVIGSVEVVEPFIRLLDNDNFSARPLAKALGLIGSVEAVEPLIKLLGDDSPRVVISAAKALGLIGSVEAVEPLIMLLDHEDSGVRRSSAKALGLIGSVEAVEPLIGLLDHEDSEICLNAASVLVNISHFIDKKFQNYLFVNLNECMVEGLYQRKYSNLIYKFKIKTGHRFLDLY